MKNQEINVRKMKQKIKKYQFFISWKNEYDFEIKTYDDLLDDKNKKQIAIYICLFVNALILALSYFIVPIFLGFLFVSVVVFFYFYEKYNLIKEMLPANDFLLNLMDYSFLNQFENNKKSNTYFYMIFPFNQLLKLYQKNKLTYEKAKDLIIVPFDYDELIAELKEIDEKTKAGLSHFLSKNSLIYQLVCKENFYHFLIRDVNYDTILQEYQDAFQILHKNAQRLNENEIQHFSSELNEKLFNNPSEIIDIKMKLNQLVIDKFKN